MDDDLYIVKLIQLQTETDTVRNDSWQIQRERIRLVPSSDLPALACSPSTVRWLHVQKVVEVRDYAVDAEAEKFRQGFVTVAKRALEKREAALRLAIAKEAQARAQADLEEIAAREKGQLP